jgi:hypothetical protein
MSLVDSSFTPPKAASDSTVGALGTTVGVVVASAVVKRLVVAMGAGRVLGDGKTAGRARAAASDHCPPNRGNSRTTSMVVAAGCARLMPG